MSVLTRALADLARNPYKEYATVWFKRKGLSRMIVVSQRPRIQPSAVNACIYAAIFAGAFSLSRFIDLVDTSCDPISLKGTTYQFSYLSHSAHQVLIKTLIRDLAFLNCRKRRIRVFCWLPMYIMCNTDKYRNTQFWQPNP